MIRHHYGCDNHNLPGRSGASSFYVSFLRSQSAKMKHSYNGKYHAARNLSLLKAGEHTWSERPSCAIRC